LTPSAACFCRLRALIRFGGPVRKDGPPKLCKAFGGVRLLAPFAQGMAASALWKAFWGAPRRGCKKMRRNAAAKQNVV